MGLTEEDDMLLRFEVGNHRSIGEPAELSMIAVDRDRVAARKFELLNEQVLTVAGIYGANASGKSNLIDALAWLSSAVTRSLRVWDSSIPRNPFRFQGYPGKPSIFEIEMIARGVRYAYTLEVDDESILYERLVSYPERRPRVLFERAGLKLELRRGLGALSGVRELLTPTTLTLSAALRFNDDEVGPFGRHLQRITDVGVLGRGRRMARRSFTNMWRYSQTERIFIDSDDPNQPALFDSPTERFQDRASALTLLRFADLGIGDVQIIDSAIGDDEERLYKRSVCLVHKAGQESVVFEMLDESEGTQMWFRLIGPVLSALKMGDILLFDEIDASLHPNLSVKLLELFQDSETNPRGAQLIFTSHDTSLLNHLNRDEVWLTEKSSSGETRLTALAEFGGDKVRKSLNLERAYLQGRFGAVPELDQAVLRGVLHLLAEDH